MTIRETTEKVRTAGPGNSRIVPESDGKYRIEVNVNGTWTPTMTGISNRAIAEDILRQADSKVLLG